MHVPPFMGSNLFHRIFSLCMIKLGNFGKNVAMQNPDVPSHRTEVYLKM
jgi:hypothetical protein